MTAFPSRFTLKIKMTEIDCSLTPGKTVYVITQMMWIKSSSGIKEETQSFVEPHEMLLRCRFSDAHFAVHKSIKGYSVPVKEYRAEYDAAFAELIRTGKFEFGEYKMPEHEEEGTFHLTWFLNVTKVKPEE